MLTWYASVEVGKMGAILKQILKTPTRITNYSLVETHDPFKTPPRNSIISRKYLICDTYQFLIFGGVSDFDKTFRFRKTFRSGVLQVCFLQRNSPVHTWGIRGVRHLYRMDIFR